MRHRPRPPHGVVVFSGLGHVLTTTGQSAGQHVAAAVAVVGPGRPYPPSTAAFASFSDAVQLPYASVRSYDATAASVSAFGAADASASPTHASPVSHTPFPHAPARAIPNTRDARVFHRSSDIDAFVVTCVAATRPPYTPTRSTAAITVAAGSTPAANGGRAGTTIDTG